MQAILLSVTLAAASIAAAPPDPYATPPSRSTPQRLAYDAMHGGPDQDAAIEHWLAAHPESPLAIRAMLAHRICLDYGRHTHGERWRAACALSVALNPGLDDDDLNAATALRTLPAIETSGCARITLSSNSWGSRNADVTVNDITLPWVVDTGAGMSVVTEATAAKLGVRRIDGSVGVETATSIKPTAGFGVIDRLRIGGAEVRHMPVIILPDAALTFDGHTVPAIFGLPAMVAFGEMTWGPGPLLQLGPVIATGSASKPVAVYWHEDGIGLPIATPSGVIGIVLDTGAYATHLRTPIEQLLTPAQLAGRSVNDGRLAGAGGTAKIEAATLPRFDFTLAGAPVHLISLQIERNDDSSGWLGNDIWAQLSELSIDFRTMTLQVTPRNAISAR